MNEVALECLFMISCSSSSSCCCCKRGGRPPGEERRVARTTAPIRLDDAPSPVDAGHNAIVAGCSANLSRQH